jgi:hypothetical protein
MNTKESLALMSRCIPLLALILASGLASAVHASFTAPYYAQYFTSGDYGNDYADDAGDHFVQNVLLTTSELPSSKTGVAPSGYGTAVTYAASLVPSSSSSMVAINMGASLKLSGTPLRPTPSGSRFDESSSLVLTTNYGGYNDAFLDAETYLHEQLYGYYSLNLHGTVAPGFALHIASHTAGSFLGLIDQEWDVPVGDFSIAVGKQSAPFRSWDYRFPIGEGRLEISMVRTSTGFPATNVADSWVAGNYVAGLQTVTSLPGDYNNDGRIDGHDFIVWQQEMGSLTNLSADGNHDGVVNSIDYALWRDNVGASSSATSAAPEPASAWLLGAASMALAIAVRRPKC